MEEEQLTQPLILERIFDVREISKKEGGLFVARQFADHPLYVTFNRLLTREVGAVISGLRKSQKLQIARQLLQELQDAEIARQKFPYPPTSPFLIDISNAVAREVESYNLGDRKKRLALHKESVAQILAKYLLQRENELHS